MFILFVMVLFTSCFNVIHLYTYIYCRCYVNSVNIIVREIAMDNFLLSMPVRYIVTAVREFIKSFLLNTKYNFDLLNIDL